MDDYARLRDNLKHIGGMNTQGVICQGIVKAINGNTCEVQVGSMVVPDVRLRASVVDDESELLIVPKVGSAVVMGSLTGDMSGLVVLQVDHAESITLNGGTLGGLINIAQLTEKINALVDAFNSHTHQVSTTGTATAQTGTAAAVTSPAQSLNKEDYEDTRIKH